MQTEARRRLRETKDLIEPSFFSQATVRPDGRPANRTVVSRYEPVRSTEKLASVLFIDYDDHSLEKEGWQSVALRLRAIVFRLLDHPFSEVFPRVAILLRNRCADSRPCLGRIGALFRRGRPLL